MPTILERLFSLDGKVALVTGASGGIGSAIANGYAEAGATVGIHGTDSAKIESVCAAIQAKGGLAHPFPGDLRLRETTQDLIQAIRTKCGRLDILVNCAGINRRKPIRQVPEDDFDAILEINLKSLFFLSQAAHLVMKSQGGGKIINIGSLTSTVALGGIAVYGATKAAVGQLTKTMALEWARDNIQVNCLAPGFIQTPLTDAGLWNDPHRRQWILERVPAGRPGRPDELVAAALLLASPGSSFITGQIINVDGGFLAGGSWLKEFET